jgi:transcriptional regulator with XRE-family HTH domain
MSPQVENDYNPAITNPSGPNVSDDTGMLEPLPGSLREELRRQVAARLREWRVRRGFTQAALARDSGIDQSSVSNYESGRREAPLPALLRLMAALNVSLGDLVDLPQASGSDEVIVARASVLGEAVARLVSSGDDYDHARAGLEAGWKIHSLARAAVADAAREGADVASAAVAAADRALALSAEQPIDGAAILSMTTRGAVAEASLISETAAQRVREALEAHRLEQPPD